MDATRSYAGSSPASLPIKHNLTLFYVSSLVIALLLIVASGAGLLYRDRVYPTDELLQAFVSTDVVSLGVGVPILLGSMWLARRGKLIGLLFWPGALMYVLYDHIAYVHAVPLSWVLPLHMALVVLSAYTTIGLVASIDAHAVQERLSGAVPAKLAGGVLVGLGGLFLLLVVGTIGGALVDGTPLPEEELAVWISDAVTVPAWIIGGVMLWRREALGYAIGAGLLFQGSMLFIGLIIVLLLQPLLTAASFALSDVIVVFFLSLICFVPFGLYVRAVQKSGA
jgi:hypothetical protein